MFMKKQQLQKGFTLIELLLVIAIIAILAAIVIIAINPSRQLSQANNAQRRSDVNTILNAAYQYAIDNSGVLPANIPAATVGAPNGDEICRSDVATTTCGGGVVLTELYDSELYIVGLPTDPTGSSTTGTGYFIVRSTSTNARVTVSTPSAELGETIQVTR